LSFYPMAIMSSSGTSAENSKHMLIYLGSFLS
jgi:hypothetical protein